MDPLGPWVPERKVRKAWRGFLRIFLRVFEGVFGRFFWPKRFCFNLNFGTGFFGPILPIAYGVRYFKVWRFFRLVLAKGFFLGPAGKRKIGHALGRARRLPGFGRRWIFGRFLGVFWLPGRGLLFGPENVL